MSLWINAARNDKRESLARTRRSGVCGSMSALELGHSCARVCLLLATGQQHRKMATDGWPRDELRGARGTGHGFFVASVKSPFGENQRARWWSTFWEE